MPESKMCLACNREFSVEDQRCPSDGTELVLLRDSIIGAMIDDRYKVVGLVTKTSSSATYEVEDMRTAGAKYWLIMLTRLIESPDDWRHLTTRVEQLAELKSPFILPFLRFGIVDRKQFYWIAPAFPLTNVALADAPKFEVGLSILSVIAQALADCHAQGVTHSNLSPSAILIARGDDGELEPKLTDFMLGPAKSWSGSGYTCVDFNELIGNAAYMSPEQLMGKSVGPSADIYTFGCLMYDILTGRPPFIGAHVLATAHLQVTERPPRFADVNNKVKIPNEIEMVARRCLEKEPEARFGSMQDVVRALGC